VATEPAARGTAGASGPFKVINPANGAVLAELSADGRGADRCRGAESAGGAKKWAALSGAERGRVLHRAGAHAARAQ